MKLSLHLTDAQSSKLDQLSGLRNLRGASPRACRSTVLRELIDRAAAEELPATATIRNGEATLATLAFKGITTPPKQTRKPQR